MAVMTRVFKWDGVYYLRFEELPDDGLAALKQELYIAYAKAGIGFNDSVLLEDVVAEIKKRAAQNS